MEISVSSPGNDQILPIESPKKTIDTSIQGMNEKLGFLEEKINFKCLTENMSSEEKFNSDLNSIAVSKALVKDGLLEPEYSFKNSSEFVSKGECPSISSEELIDPLKIINDTDLPESHLMLAKVSPSFDTEIHKENTKHTLDKKDLSSNGTILPEKSKFTEECEEHSPPKRFKADEILFPCETEELSVRNSILNTFEIQDSNFLPNITLLTTFPSQKKNLDNVDKNSEINVVETQEKAYNHIQKDNIRKEILTASIEKIDKKFGDLTSDDIKSPHPAVPSVSQNGIKSVENVLEEHKIEKLSFQQNCVVDGLSTYMNQSTEECSSHKNDFVQPVLEVKVRDSSFSDSFKYENKCSKIIQQHLKRSCPSTPGVIYNIRKIKKIRINCKSTKEINNSLSEVHPEVTKHSDFKTLVQLNTTTESVSMNNDANFSMLPSLSINCDTSSKPTVSNILISDIPSTSPQNLSPIKHKEMSSLMKVTEEKSTNTSFKGKDFNEYKTTYDKSTSVSEDKKLYQCKTTETSTNTSFEEKYLNLYKSTEAFKGKEFIQYETIENESTNFSFEGKELNQCKTEEKCLKNYIENKSVCSVTLDLVEKELPTLISRYQSMNDERSCVELSIKDKSEDNITKDESKTVSDLNSDRKDPEISLKERESLISTAATYPVTSHLSLTLPDKESNVKDQEMSLKEREFSISATATYPITSHPLGTLLDKESNSNIDTNLCEETGNKMSPPEEKELSLDQFIESLNPTLSGKESRITLKTIKDSRAVFKIKWGPWIYKCGLVLNIEQDKPNQTRISFEQEEYENDWLVNLGYNAFHFLVKEKVIYNPFCSKKTILKLSEYSAIAYKVEILMQDLFKVSLSFSFSISDNMDDLEVNLNMVNDNRQSSYCIICPVDLNSYPSKKIVPQLKHRYLNDITEEAKNAISLVEPGRSYIWNIAKAASKV